MRRTGYSFEAAIAVPDGQRITPSVRAAKPRWRASDDRLRAEETDAWSQRIVHPELGCEAVVPPRPAGRLPEPVILIGHVTGHGIWGWVIEFVCDDLRGRFAECAKPRSGYSGSGPASARLAPR